MIAVEFNGQTCHLVTTPPDLSLGAPTLHVRVPTERDRSNTGREDRYGLGGTLRVSAWEWSGRMELADFSAQRNVLQARQAETVLAPLWLLKRTGAEWADGDSVSCGATVAWSDDLAAFTIDPATPGDWDWIAPLLVGRFLEDPKPQSHLHDEVVQVKFRFAEDDDSGYALDPAEPAAGLEPPAIGGEPPPVFPWEADWSALPKSGGATAVTDYIDVGWGRRVITVHYPQAAAIPLEASVTLTTTDDILGLLGWWLARRGDVGEHWVSTLLGAARLAANAAAGDTALQVEDAALLGANRYLVLHRMSDGAREIVRVTSIVGNTLNLSAPLQQAVQAMGTRLSLAILARHDMDELALTFANDAEAAASFKWLELTEEYSTPVDETRGVTLGRLPDRAYLLRIDQDFLGDIESHYATTYDKILTALDADWTPRVFGFTGDITQTLGLENDEAKLRCEDWAGGPWGELRPRGDAPKTTAALYQCDVVAGEPTGLELIWTGNLRGVSFDGPIVDVDFDGFNALFDVRGPLKIIQRGCNAEVYDDECTLLKAAWTHTATVVAIDGVAVTLGGFARPGGLAAGFGFETWFALGYVEWTTGGRTRRSRIHRSMTIDGGGQIVIVTARTITAAVGDEVNVVPGCDGAGTTCKTYNAASNPTGKFDNYEHFRGFDEVPDAAPSFQAPERSSSYGKK